MERNLNIVASDDSDDVLKSLTDFRSALTTMILGATELFKSLDNLSLPEKRSTQVNTRDSISSPVKSEAVAISKSFVLDEIDDGRSVSELKSFDNGAQVCKVL
jgi:hypothetical protein